jgi:hypothetical protein
MFRWGFNDSVGSDGLQADELGYILGAFEVHRRMRTRLTPGPDSPKPVRERASGVGT